MEAGSGSREDQHGRLVERVQELQAALDDAGDSATRELAEALVASVVQMYGMGLEQIVSRLMAAGPEGERIAVSLTDDPLVSTLFLIHDLHPVPLADRVQAALDSVRPYMESHGGGVELLGIDNGVARIFLRGSCSDCSASTVTLELAIKQALEDMAPDLEGLEVEGVAPQTVNGVGLPMVTGSAPTGMELPIVMSDGNRDDFGPARPPVGPPSWYDVHSVGEVANGIVVPVAVAGLPLMIANVDGTLLAYRDICASCGGTMHDGTMNAGALVCRHCERSFFLPRAGRSMDGDKLQLEPVPLLRENGHVKVALAV
jgi:Fe-S cluster biogenesis protein NfuA/nitrite reductase/ring-hydroxylating ferredoxin subunit